MIHPLVIGLLGIAIFLSLLLHMGIAPIPTPSFKTTTVTATAADGTHRATINARLATTYRQQYIGLSRTDSLPPDEGMLFVFGRETKRTIAMRAMEFPLDIIFINTDGRITAIETAAEPQGLRGYLLQERHRAECTAVLEVNAGWAENNNVQQGDIINWTNP